MTSREQVLDSPAPAYKVLILRDLRFPHGFPQKGLKNEADSRHSLHYSKPRFCSDGRDYSCVTHQDHLNVTRASENTRGEEKQGAQEFEHARYLNAQQAERQEQQPNDRIKDQRQKGQRPAEDEEYAPEQEAQHQNPPAILFNRNTQEPSRKFLIGLETQAEVSGCGRPTPAVPPQDSCENPAPRNGEPGRAHGPARGSAHRRAERETSCVRPDPPAWPDQSS